MKRFAFATGWSDIQRDCAQTRCFHSSVKKYVAKAVEHCLLFRLGMGYESFVNRFPPSGAAFSFHWYAVLSGERVSPQQEARWHSGMNRIRITSGPGSRLKTCEPAWRCAWRRCQPGVARYPPTRRHVMKGLLLLLGAGGGWHSGSRKPAKVCGQITAPPKARQPSATGRWLPAHAEYPKRGDVRFDAHQRTVRLWYGEIAILPRKMPCNAPSVS